MAEIMWNWGEKLRGRGVRKRKEKKERKGLSS
jgi:hypothetical protein